MFVPLTPPALVAPPSVPSLAVRIADALTEAVAAGVIEPGERLVETEIAARLGVSRVPLREALKLLEAQGIVAVTAHRGARVTPFDDTRIGQVCEARIALERLALKTAVPRIAGEPPLLQALQRLIDAMRLEGRRQPGSIAASKADLAFHRLIVEASGNEIVATLWEGLARHVLIVFSREARKDRTGPVLAAHHRKLLDLLASGDVLAASREIEPHILRLRRQAG